MLEAYTTLGYLAAVTERVRAARVGHRRRLPGAGAARQGGHDPRRALEGSRLARHRCRLERGGVRGSRPALPPDRRAVRAPRGDPADLPADVGRQRRALRGQALPARQHAQLPAVGAAAAPADPHRWRGREEDPADGRAVRPGVQPLRQPRPRPQARRAARPLRRPRPRLRRDREDRDELRRPRARGREGRRGARPPAPSSRLSASRTCTPASPTAHAPTSWSSSASGSSPRPPSSERSSPTGRLSACAAGREIPTASARCRVAEACPPYSRAMVDIVLGIFAIVAGAVMLFAGQFVLRLVLPIWGLFRRVRFRRRYFRPTR